LDTSYTHKHVNYSNKAKAKLVTAHKLGIESDRSRFQSVYSTVPDIQCNM